MKLNKAIPVIVVIAFTVLFGLTSSIYSSANPTGSLSINPTEDALADVHNILSNGDNLGVQGQTITTCEPTIESFLKFALSEIADPITSATLTLRSNFSSGTLTLGLFGSNKDDWSEVGGIPWANRPALDADLNTTSGIVTSGENVTFPDSPELVAFLEAQRAGDGTATFVITTVSCAGTSTQSMDSRDRVGGAAPILDIITTPTCTTYDFNGDGFIDLDDINTVLFNSIFVNAPYDSRYDLVPDGVVDIADIFAVAVRFGQACPPTS